MDILSPEIIEKLLNMPVLLVVLYVMWNNNKTTMKQLDIIEGFLAEKQKK